MEIKYVCPFGKKCEDIKKVKGEPVLFRCRWYIKVRGKHPQEDTIIDNWDCALVWQVTATLSVAQTNRGTVRAIETWRNEMLKAIEASGMKESEFAIAFRRDAIVTGDGGVSEPKSKVLDIDKKEEGES